MRVFTINKRINKEQIENIINSATNRKQADRIIAIVMDSLNNYHLNKWKEKSSAGAIRRLYENETVDKKIAIKAWKLMNIKNKAYRQVKRMQENNLYMGTRKAKCTGNDKLKYCPLCPGDRKSTRLNSSHVF